MRSQQLPEEFYLLKVRGQWPVFCAEDALKAIDKFRDLEGEHGMGVGKVAVWKMTHEPRTDCWFAEQMQVVREQEYLKPVEEALSE